MISVATAWAAWTAAERVHEDEDRRVNDVRALLEDARFPLTSYVLQQLRLLTGAEFVLLDQNGAPASSTVPDVSEAELNAMFTDSEAPLPSETDVLVAGLAYRSELIESGRVGGSPDRVVVLFPRDRLRALKRDAMIGPLLTGSWILALTVLATTWILHRFGRRLQRIERQAARIAGGDFAPLPLPRRDDEIRDLARSINQMADGLQNLTGTIREAERSRLITQVVAGLAHQLRNAMTGVRMAIQVHQRRCRNEADSSLDVALGQLSLTEQQIRGLLGLSRGENRSVAPGAAATLLDEIATMIGPVCEHRRIEFTYQTDCDRDAAVADADAFRSAVLNLCMNGVEAAGRPGTLSLVAHQEGERLDVAIGDNGAGVPEQIRESLFQPFVTTKSEGVGLGLALAHAAAEELGGELKLSRDSGQTVFTFRCCVMNSPALAT